MEDIYRLTVSVTVGKGQYGYDRITDREFQVSAPVDVLRRIEMTATIEALFRHVLDEIEQDEQALDL